MGLFLLLRMILRHSVLIRKKIYMPIYKKSFAFPSKSPYIKSTINV